MTVPTAVRLANDIAAQFQHLPPDRAAQAVADHLRTFWEPRMTRALRDLVQQGEQGDLDPIALAATALLPA
jgi:formate dehydrogenase subunit delta